MNNNGLLSQLLKDNSDPFIFEDGKCVLTYSSLKKELNSRSLEEDLSINNSYKLLVWEGRNTKEFIINYLGLINNGHIPVLVDKSRLDKSDYDTGELEKSHFTKISDLNDCATIIYTSGSTGRPKGVRISLSNFFSSAKATNELYQIKANDNWVLSLPLYHIGAVMILWRTLLEGASVTLGSPSSIIEDILGNPQVTMASLVQLQLERALCASKNVQKRFSNLKGIVLGGSKVNESLLKEAINKDLTLSNSFGATESCAQFIATPLSQDISILKTSGRPMAGSIERENNCALLKGDAIALGYLGEEDFDNKFQTSDEFEITEDGNIVITGRNDFVFQKASENINPEIIEEKLACASLNSHYIVPIKNQHYENLTALVYSGPRPIREIQAICKQALTSFEMPHLIYQADTLSDYYEGIKIDRGLLKKLVNNLHFNIGHELKVSACGNPDGEVIIVGHGFMGEALDFEFLSHHLKKEYLLLYIDLPGHGLNMKVNTLSTFSSSILNLIKTVENSQRRLSFITYSMSARIYNELLRDPSLKEYNCFKHFINESGAPGFTQDQQARKLRLAHDTSIFDDIDSGEEFFSNWYLQSVFQGLNEASIYKDLLEQKASQYKQMKPFWREISPVISVATQEDLRDLSTLPRKLSYYYIFGSNDQKYANYKDSYKGRKIKSFEITNASHNTHLMNPKMYLSKIKEILNF